MFDEAPEQTPEPAHQWNLWKLGFFIMLILFEIAREWAVLASYQAPRIAVLASVDQVQNLVTAVGRWKRLDGGEPLQAGAVKIECWRNEGRCHEVSYSVGSDGFVSQPSLDTFDAKFSDDAVTYGYDDPTCARYSVRIDLKLNKVIATRDRKNSPTNKLCTTLEPRIEMSLGDGFVPINPTKGHFVPIVWLLRLPLATMFST